MHHPLLDMADADTRVEFGMAEAEFAQHTQWRASAEVFRAIDATLREAAEHPEVFIDAVMLRGDAVEFAERAAAADLAVRLSLAESTVRAYGMVAQTLQQSLPLLWARFAEGDISTQNAREAASIVSELPADLWAEFQTRIMGAITLAPARFRTTARAVREKLHAQTLTERHGAANAHRGVWTEVDRDGMGRLHAHLSAEKLAMVGAALDGLAFGLFTESDEQRTMAQLRADVLSDLLTATSSPCTSRACTSSAGTSSAGTSGAGTRPAVGVTVALTIPVLSLLGHFDEPALLEGIGPIDINTARRLCATVPSITRLLTDPVSGTIVGIDPRQYRVPTTLKRWLATLHVTCDFPGCGRRAAHCDLDHTRAWANGGTTTADNLNHRCRTHHTMKHQTKWQVEKPPGAERAVWTSPTGYNREADPPPF
ncbi:HNH endonuclease signature motif containing protein [Frigoribacterium sp. CG_9.8]|uniref:HNH endonuclease signature motif containing protein n=1 Tax=Frigoribacterium sp. CG_9.8 TaxID=2787733 RepID=UPI0018CB5B33|nr:HNH endonuclease signature motif containing protein [Frigoribacterium sp. CG_9.8]MBG6107936.1 hypothetical protein [Frigoribacterium sp. CG_9.8]